jgi:hypothetical protein
MWRPPPRAHAAAMTDMTDMTDTTSGPHGRPTTSDGSWMAWAAGGIAGIWVAVALISVFSPDMVTGSEQQHLPVAAFGTWMWGLVATAAFVWSMGRLRGSGERRPIWIGLAGATTAVWLVATVLSVALPRVETGSDPTRIPIGAMVSPVAAMALSVFAGIVAGVFSRPPAPT